MVNRREFLRQGSLFAAGLAATSARKFQQPSPQAPIPVVLDPASLAPFVDPLPIPEIIRSTESRANPENATAKIPYFYVQMREAGCKVHRDLPPTRMWTFNGSFPGPTFDVNRGEPVLVEWANALPAKHFLPIDHKIHGAEAGVPEVRSVVHLHGGRVPAKSDGYPEDWFIPGKSAIAFYPNNQDAAALWYHDHAMGINRLNIYAGLAGLYIIRDPEETALNLPAGKYEIPLVICDRMFGKDGQLYYPISGQPDAPWLPDVSGNAFLINGKLLPYLEVETRKYRFRILNVSNGRFYHLALENGATMHQIGSDQGLLAAPVSLKQVTIAPAERLDVIVDFSGHAGERILLKNDFSSPLMQFRVASGNTKDAAALPAVLRTVPRTPESEAIKTRQLSIDEYRDLAGNTTLMLLNKSYWHMPITETPVLNTTEIWEIVNSSDDSHPIHLHLVRFQILDRRRFETFTFNTTGKLRYMSAAVPPGPAEMGWKDTARADPGMVTRIIVKFEGYAGRYVWHCHVLEHEDNEMMRPFEVVPAG